MDGSSLSHIHYWAQERLCVQRDRKQVLCCVCIILNSVGQGTAQEKLHMADILMADRPTGLRGIAYGRGSAAASRPHSAT